MIDDRDMETSDMEETHRIIEIDDRFMDEWVEFGLREMTAYLAKHARFERFLTERDTAL
jgi:hypothetical protein